MLNLALFSSLIRRSGSSVGSSKLAFSRNTFVRNFSSSSDPSPFEKPPKPEDLELQENNTKGPIIKPTRCSVYSFGLGRKGQLGIGSAIEFSATPQLVQFPIGAEKKKHLPEVFDIQAGFHQCMVISGPNETVWGWGMNDFGQVGIITRGSMIVPEPVHVDSMKGLGVIGAACGRAHTFFFTKNREIYSVGGGELGQLGLGHRGKVRVPMRIDKLKGLPISMVTSGLDHGVVLTEDHHIYTWGWGVDGQLGHGNYDDQLEPKRIELIDDLKPVRVCCGNDYTTFITEDGELWVFGNNEVGQLGLGDTELRNGPCMIESVSNEGVIAVSCGGTHALALTQNHEVFSWGYTGSGQLGLANVKQNEVIPKPQRVEALKGKKVIGIAAGGGHSMALTEDKRVYVWGLGLFGRLGLGNERDHYVPVELEFFRGKNVTLMALGIDVTLVMVED